MDEYFIEGGGQEEIGHYQWNAVGPEEVLFYIGTLNLNLNGTSKILL